MKELKQTVKSGAPSTDTLPPLKWLLNLVGRGETLYLLSLFIYVWYEIVKLSMMTQVLSDAVFNVMRVVSLLLLALSEVAHLRERSKSELRGPVAVIRDTVINNPAAFIYAVALIGFSAISFLTSDVFYPVYTALYVVSARNYQFERIARAGFYAILSATAACLILCLLGVIEDYVWVQADGNRVRHGLGFLYATYTSFFVLYATLLLLYLHGGRLGIVRTLLVVVIDVAVYLLTDSRTAFILVLVSLALAWLTSSEQPVVKKVVAVLLKASPALFVAIVVLSIVLMVVYDPTNVLLEKINDGLGNRLSISHYTFSQNGITLFGQFVEMHGQGIMENGARYTAGPVTFIDNSFCHIAVRQGVAVLVLFVGAELLLLKKLSEEGRSLEAALLMVIAIHSFIDSWYLMLCMNLFILLIGTELLKPRHCR